MIKQTKFGWVDLSNLPKTKTGKLDWQNSAGCIIPFQYQDVRSNIYISKYISYRCINITINDYVRDYQIARTQVVNGELGGVLQKITPYFRYRVGDVINEKLLILSAYMNGKYKTYNYRCLVDGYIGHISEDSLRRGRGCPVCGHHVVMRGVNDVATTHPDVAALFWDKGSVYKYSAFSRSKDDFRCPNCGNKVNATISNVTTQGLSCPRCGDGFSYPEKFVFNVLKQAFKLHLDILCGNDFEVQKTFDWSKNILHNNPKLSGEKIYDFYIPIQGGLLIEAHGLHHFEQCLYHTRPRDKTLEEEQENDRIKYNIAIQNGISSENYIVLDCRKSTTEFIKHSMMSSNLPSLLNFTESDIDWNQCDKFATSSRLYEACCYWNDGVKNYKEIALLMKMHHDTIRRYIKKGRELNIIND
jgi:DNA-directed RNA polymerase subunit RPC12/RpoP